MDSAMLAERQRPNQRLWRDLSKRRLFLALGLSPLLPFVLGFLLILMLGGALPIDMLAILGGILAAAEAWSLVLGSIVMLVLVWIRGALRRGDCLMLGVLLAFSLPYAALLADIVVDWITGAGPPEAGGLDDFEGPSNQFFATAVAVILIPFGALGGWIFWRVGVRPAQPKMIDVAPVFD